MLRFKVAMAFPMLATVLWLLWVLALQTGLGQSVRIDEPGAGAGAQSGAQVWRAWTPDRVVQGLAQGRPVFVDFTAAWCVTCQYNKKVVLSDATVLDDFEQKRVQLLRADWTRRDPAIAQALAQLGRSGVPVYVLYRPGAVPVVLPEVLSVAGLRAQLAQF
jgi:thiol:disulfide interchange protein